MPGLSYKSSVMPIVRRVQSFPEEAKRLHAQLEKEYKERYEEMAKE